MSASRPTRWTATTPPQARVLEKKLNESLPSPMRCWRAVFPMGGESDSVNFMVNEMVQWLALALPFVYLVMVAQFQSLLSPSSSCLPSRWPSPAACWVCLHRSAADHDLLMGFIVLMGTVVNNGTFPWTTPTSCVWRRASAVRP